MQRICHAFRKKICLVQNQRLHTGKTYFICTAVENPIHTVLISQPTREVTQETNRMYAISARKPSTHLAPTVHQRTYKNKK